jgi:CRISPR-associated endonuclease Csn1
MKKILGLDLGTNSIGWALVEKDFETKSGRILGMGSRIIPMSQDIMGDFEKGNKVSQTAERTRLRSVRRLRERHLLRRQRLLRVLHLIGFLPPHFDAQINWTNKPGQFIPGTEPKLAYDAKTFIFKNAFEAMLDDFRKHQPEILKNVKGQPSMIPQDWTIYYLRKKATIEKIEKFELAWLLLHFNQKRGYYQLRGEEEAEKKNKLEEYVALKVIDVHADEPQKGKSDIWYNVILENGWVYRRSSKQALFDWIDKVKEFVVTTEIQEDGLPKLNKEGEIQRSFRAPGEDDWTLIKKKTEQSILTSQKTVGAYIYDNLLADPQQKIKGKLIRTVERKFYKDELHTIFKEQSKHHLELVDPDLFQFCVVDLYSQNEPHAFHLKNKDFTHLICEDIIFYQRPLRSQKSAISKCPLEKRWFKGKDNQLYSTAITVTPKSNPIFQEFRLLQWMHNLRIYEDESNLDFTEKLIPDLETRESLFEFLNYRKEVKQDEVLKFLLGKNGVNKKDIAKQLPLYRWNYVVDKIYPANPTLYLIHSKLNGVVDNPQSILTQETLHSLWHILYSVKDPVEFQSALTKFAQKNQINEEEFLKAFKKTTPFQQEYASYSEKAIKKLLPLMRFGKYWSWENISDSNKKRILDILNAEANTEIPDKVREIMKNFSHENQFQGLPLWIAQYIVYNRHSEPENIEKWNSPSDIDNYIKQFKQHSLRNPIVEQITIETLRVVQDIWQKIGQGQSDFFDEIHVELGRDMKNSAEERKKISNRINTNENTNMRIKALLQELFETGAAENVRPHSPMQQEILKIYEEGVLQSQFEIEDDIKKISRSAQPSSAELKRYKLWLEQKYRSPYTGAIIPLSKLFTHEYEIEHIIPQSRFFDDSLSNKVICESAVNKLKGNQLGLEFIKNHHGEIINLGLGKTIRIFEPEEYIEFVKNQYQNIPSKKNKLLLEDIPEKMVERQLNDTRYISRTIFTLLSKIVRADKNDEGVNSINMIPVTGVITNELKNDWGLNDVWNDLILWRFERLNQLTNSQAFTSWNEKYQKHLPTVPLELSAKFSKKRIDHRHHALDALVIACTTRDHVNLLNNLFANSPKRHYLSRKLRNYEKNVYTDVKTGNKIEREIPAHFLKPWQNFTQDARQNLDQIIVSFKQNIRIINKATNYYEKWVEENGVTKKKKVKQEGVNWAIRKSMHKDTVCGKVDLPFVKVPKGKVVTAVRKAINSEFDYKKIESITDTGIQKILKNYLDAKGGDPEIAFSPEGLQDMNKNISEYNDGKAHQPIYKARVYELGSRFPLSDKGNKAKKFVEADKGTNLFFAIYANPEGKRSYASIPLIEAIERQKQGLPPVPEINEKGDPLLFWLSPGDLVSCGNEIQVNNIYKFVSSSGYQAFFIKNDVSSPILNKVEFSALNKMERALNGLMIKEVCEKIKVNRLGQIEQR